MHQKVAEIIEQIRPNLVAEGSDIQLMGVTNRGIVRINLSGECCTGNLLRIKTVLAVESILKQRVPGVNIVIEELPKNVFLKKIHTLNNHAAS